MIWNISFAVSVACMIAGLIIAIFQGCKKNVKNRDTRVFFTLAATVFASATVMFFAEEYTKQSFEGAGGPFNAVLVALHDAIGMFVVDGDFAFMADSMQGMLPWLVPICSVYMAVLYIIAPVFTFGFLLSFVKNIRSRVRLALCKRADTYVFSELNDKSLALAQDIKRKDRRRVIVFCDVFESDEEKSADQLAQAKRIGALVFDRDIADMNFKKHAVYGSLYFFITGEKDTENVNQAIALIREYGELEKANLYLFSDSASGELLMSNIESHKMKIRRIDESFALIQRTLYENPTAVFDSAREVAENGDKIISAVIVGMGGYGREMFKTLLWYGQMDGYRLHLHVFDQSENIEQELKYLCPEILSEQYNGKYVPGEAFYSVKVHGGMRVGTEKFANALAKITDASFVLISLGNDDLNVQTATGMRVIFERMKISPTIYAVVHNGELAKCLQGRTNHSDQAYRIEPIGALEQSYTEDVVMRSALEQDALDIHCLGYGGKPEEFFAYEYNYRSSAASALHNRARSFLKIHGAHLPAEQRTPEQELALASLEHCRWNAYMRSHGYVYSGSKDKTSRNDLGKMHHNLVEFKALNKGDQKKDYHVVDVSTDAGPDSIA